MVSTGNVEAINPSGSTDKTMVINTPSSSGTYYYGAIIGTVSGEINTSNNVSAGVRVEVGYPAINNRPHLESTGQTTSSISLSWDAVSGAESYELQRNGGAIYTGSDTSYTDTGLSDNTKYTYTVRGVNPDDNGPWSSGVDVWTDVADLHLRIAWNTFAANDYAYDASPFSDKYPDPFLVIKIDEKNDGSIDKTYTTTTYYNTINKTDLWDIDIDLSDDTNEFKIHYEIWDEDISQHDLLIEGDNYYSLSGYPVYTIHPNNKDEIKKGAFSSISYTFYEEK